MKITFKDVGQGDTIIIEWSDEEGNQKIGIVDCKLKAKKNPVIEYLKQTDYKEIAFLILSHPHADHFNGYLELLNYLDEQQMTIHRVGHTVLFAGAQAYWKYFVIDTSERTLFEDIIAKWYELKKSGRIKRMDMLSDGKVLDIDKNMIITCLSPAHDDIVLYQTKVKLDAVVNEEEARAAANILSTILKVSYKEHNVLLTADAEKTNFIGVRDRDANHLTSKRFHICQLPHHGSKSNYSEDFMTLLDIADPQFAVASAGGRYGHPSMEVLKLAHDAGYKVHCTNIAGGMVEYVEGLREKAKALEGHSVLADEYTVSRDRIYELDGDNMKIIN